MFEGTAMPWDVGGHVVRQPRGAIAMDRPRGPNGTPMAVQNQEEEPIFLKGYWQLLGYWNYFKWVNYGIYGQVHPIDVFFTTS